MPSGDASRFRRPKFGPCDCSRLTLDGVVLPTCEVCLELAGQGRPATKQELACSDELERLIVVGKLNGLWEAPSLSI